MITLTAILAWIGAALTNPYALVAIAAIIMALPNEWLVRVPIVGPFALAWLRHWAGVQLERFKKEREVMDAEADRIVSAKEQDIKNGKIDQSTARAQAVAELRRTFDLDLDIASRLIENQVNKRPTSEAKDGA